MTLLYWMIDFWRATEMQFLRICFHHRGLSYVSFERSESAIKTVGNLTLCHKCNSLADAGYILIMTLCTQHSHKMWEIHILGHIVASWFSPVADFIGGQVFLHSALYSALCGLSVAILATFIPWILAGVWSRILTSTSLGSSVHTLWKCEPSHQLPWLSQMRLLGWLHRWQQLSWLTLTKPWCWLGSSFF